MSSLEHLSEYKELQYLAYQCAIDTKNKLQVGMSEIDACKMMDDFLKKQGIKNYFHLPFAWFGDRTAFHNFKKPLDFSKISIESPIPHLGKEFLSTNRKLENNMAVILDVAPARNTCMADIGYSFFFGESEKYTEILKHFAPIRALILECAQKRRPISEIYLNVQKYLDDNDFKNCHGLYPLGVLGHRIGKLPMSFLPKISLMGFHPQAYLYLTKEIFKGIPSFLTQDESRHLVDGLWAIEPHLGNEDIGIKFEEILVVNGDNIYWLDERLPELRGY